MKLFAVAVTCANGLAPPPWIDDASDHSQKICPSVWRVGIDDGTSFGLEEGCYTQKPEIWTPGTDVECEMTNPKCLQVTCDGGRMQAQIQGNLFHTHGPWHESSFVDELLADERSLKINDNVLVHNDPCGYTVKQYTDWQGTHNVWIMIDWDYDTCSSYFDTDIVGEDIVYSVKIQSIGNDADKNDDIEFFVNTEIEAVCKYDRNIVTDPVNFFVNQEDTLIEELSNGKLDDVVECNFFIDPARTKPIDANNIVNMGQTIYGQVKSTLKIGDLQYRLTDLVVKDGNDAGSKTFYVIENNVNTEEVKAVSEGTADTGSTLDFSYMSFGFEDLDHQNKQIVQCHVTIEKNPNTNPCSDVICEVGEEQEVVDNTCVCFENTVQVTFTPATVAESGTSSVTGPAPKLYIGQSMQDTSFIITTEKDLDWSENPTVGTEPFKFLSGESLFIKAGSSNGAGLSSMQLEICHHVTGQTSVCKTRDVTLKGEKSFWLDEESSGGTSCKPPSSGAEKCGKMLSADMNFHNCVEEGKIELSLNDGDVALEVTVPNCQ